MNIETSYGFRSAQAAWENANPCDDECTCEGEGFVCDECGRVSDKAGPCPGADCPNIDFMRAIETDEAPEYFPSQNCPQHGWCGGCSSPKCEDCAP